MTYIVTFKQISEFIYTSDNNLSNLISLPFSYLYIRLSLITSIFLTLICN
ncbi:transporter [Neisseria sicca]|uniref:Transporter n=1 Tax=Neisseria sicca TaxID=490 RepID=A0A2I1XD29_NEISI|nr:transporter [Neisseria sicca]